MNHNHGNCRLTKGSYNIVDKPKIKRMCSIWITVQDIYANLIAEIHHDPRAKPVKFPE